MLSRASTARLLSRYATDINILRFIAGRERTSTLTATGAGCSRRCQSSSTNPASTVSSAGKKDKDKDELPYLPSPPGVPDPPLTSRKTWREEMTDLMDQDVRLARRRHLIKEASKGYYTDLNAVRKHGGKTWIAPKTLIREDHALYFPDIAGVPLSSRDSVHTTDLCKGKVSVIAMLSTVISEEHVDSFVNFTNEAFLSDPRYQFVQINLQENVLKAYLVSLYVSSLKKKIPKELHSTYLLSRQNMEYVRDSLEMNNKHIGFVYLLDQNLRIRWAGGGLATEEEAKSLYSCARVLLNRVASPDRSPS